MRPTRTMLIAAPVVVCLALAPTHCTLAPGTSDRGGPSSEVVPPACDPDGRAPCPEDTFICVTDDVGNKYCEGQESATPDGGDWDCVVQGSTLVCSGDHLPSDAGDWFCDEVEPGEVLCRRNAYVPAGGADGSWDCHYEEDHLVCESTSSGEDSPADDASEEPPSGDGADGCPPGVEIPVDEVCGDGIDNDCDGSVDEDCGGPPPADDAPPGGDEPPPGDDTPPPSDDAPPGGDEPPPGDDTPPPADDAPPGGGEPPPGCVCVPGAWRYCDTPTYCRWGIQYCDPDGMDWGTCSETSPPTICSYVASWYSPDAEACCVAAGFCCQDMWDLDFDGDVWESLGDCTDITCE